MQQSRVLFFAIIGLALLAVGGMLAAVYLFSGGVSLSSPQESVAIEIVTAPTLTAWARTAATQFNRDNPATQVTITEAGDLLPGSRFQSGGTVPAGWLAEAGFVVALAQQEGYSFTDPVSVASTPLAWGGYDDKLAALTAVDWAGVHQQALTPQGVKVVIAAPRNSAEGLAALISAVASQTAATALTETDVGQADGWLTETLGDRNATTPPRPAEAFATAQGRTLGDVGLLSEASWRQVSLDSTTGFTVQPVAPAVTLDFPLAVYSGSQAVTPAQAEAVAAFRDFLLQPAQQQALAQYGLQPAGSSAITADGRATRRLLAWSEREIR